MSSVPAHTNTVDATSTFGRRATCPNRPSQTVSATNPANTPISDRFQYRPISEAAPACRRKPDSADVKKAPFIQARKKQLPANPQ